MIPKTHLPLRSESLEGKSEENPNQNERCAHRSEMESLGDVQKFWSKVNKNGPIAYAGIGKCWMWIPCKGKNVYGNFWIGRQISTHRFSWLLHHGEVPLGLFVLHHCDNKACVRPSHLWVGTSQDNVDDMVKKDRQAKGENHGLKLHSHVIKRGDESWSRNNLHRLARGERHGSKTHPEAMLRGELHKMAKLKPDDVFHIRERHSAGESLANLGREYGVTIQNIWRIVNYRTWRHLP